MVSILVVDDHSLMRRAVREVFEGEADLEVVADACNGEEAEAMAAQTQPDVVLMDIDLPDCNGFEATERVLACSPRSRVVIFTATHQDYMVIQAIQKGAMGYITKDIEPEALLHAVRCAARNDLCIPGIFISYLVSYLRNHWRFSGAYSNMLTSPISYRTPRRSPQPATLDDTMPSPQPLPSISPRPLTERERQILDLMRKGQKNREIAGELGIAESTVHKHVQNIFEKLHARNRTEAIYLTSPEL
ncbi:MAG TPA: response regulator transcription factor [Dictyobacter sp.]|jgi:DNA-binding NarL/FixJ family response regulator|nr:response regulator transcription factor [Dictyobacter sp.]